MTVSFKVWIRNLSPEFGADALVILRPLQPAGAIATGAFQAFPDHSHHFLVIVKSDCHDHTSLPELLYFFFQKCQHKNLS